MSTIIGANKAIFGVKAKLPLKGFPEGRVKLVIRSTDFVKAFVKGPNGIRKFIVFEDDGFWTPGWEQCANYREEVTS